MARAAANGIEIEYELAGAERGRPLLMLRGLGTQLIQWPQALLDGLVASGHHVVTPDNRDVGLSSHLDDAPTPDIGAIVRALRAGEDPGVAYRLADMALDVIGLLDALEIDRVHVLGISMGGMIAQQLAIDHPARVASLVSIFSTTGDPSLPGPSEEALAVLMKPSPTDRAGWIAHELENARALSGTGYPLDDAARADLLGRCYDRAFDPKGVARQLAAVTASGDRTAALRRLDVPALVVHGDADPLVRIECGRATADAIPGARFEVFAGMGHDLPGAVAPRLVELVSTHTEVSAG